MFQSLLKPIQTNRDDDDVDTHQVRYNRYDINENLLVDLQRFHINASNGLFVSPLHILCLIHGRALRIQAWFRRCADAKEIGVNRLQIAIRIEDDESQNTAWYDICIWPTNGISFEVIAVKKEMWNEQCKVMEFRGGFHMTARVRETECQVYRDRQKYIVPAVSKAVYHWTSSKLDACVACDKLEHNKNNKRFSSVTLVIKSVEGCQMSAVWPRDLSSQYYDCGSYPAFGQQNFFDHHNIRILVGADLLSLLDERDFSSPNANPGSSKIIILWLR